MFGLGLNATLESLNLINVPLLDENAALWCMALSFLRTNKTLESLLVQKSGATVSCDFALIVLIAAMHIEREHATCQSPLPKYI
jgi:hypothetical protein